MKKGLIVFASVLVCAVLIFAGWQRLKSRPSYPNVSELTPAENQTSPAPLESIPAETNRSESGEPDMPHDTYFIREMPLYVDFNDYGEDWYDPEKEAASRYRIVDKHSYPATEEALGRLQRTFEAGLYAPESLAILNDNFKKLYISDKTSAKEIQRLYEKTAQQMENKLGIEKKTFFESALHEWPLYHFTTLRKY